MKNLRNTIAAFILVLISFIIYSCDNEIERKEFDDYSSYTIPKDTLKLLASISPEKVVASMISKRGIRSHSSIMKSRSEIIIPAKISMPVPDFDPTIFTGVTVDCFTNLANLTGGMTYYAEKSNEIVDIIREIINNRGKVYSDIVLLIDHTSSMLDDIDSVKINSVKIINALSDKINIRFAVGVYGDKNSDGEDWYNCTKLSDNFNKAKNYIDHIRMTGGGDFPESVYDAIYKTANEMNWSPNSKRLILVMGDAPSLEEPLSNHNQDDVVNMCLSKGVRANIYPIIINNGAR